MKTNPLDQLADLYADFAAHMLSIPEVTALPGVAEWLGERMLYGLPDYAAYEKSPMSRSAKKGTLKSALSDFMFPDVESDTPLSFVKLMCSASTTLRTLGMPEFPRIDELIALIPCLEGLHFETQDG